MRELSIEEKAKAYDDVVSKLGRFMAQGVDPLITRADVQDFFPELAESEDERIRKGLIEAFKKSLIVGGFHKDKVIAWLEKQGEHANFRNKIQIGDKVTRNEDGVLVNLSQLKRVAKKDEKQDEQKSYASETMNGKGDFDNGFTRMMEKEQKYAWSEEDEKMLECAIDMIEWYSVVNKSKSKLVSDWLKSLKDRIQPQPKQEWSEDDDIMVENIRNSFGLHCGQMTEALKEQYDKFFNKVKSLRPHSQWKPSDEQLSALWDSIKHNLHLHPILKSLYNDLKKLRED